MKKLKVCLAQLGLDDVDKALNEGKLYIEKCKEDNPDGILAEIVYNTEVTFFDRLIKERDELDNKIVKLDSFTKTTAFQNLEENARDLLLEQLVVMRGLSFILQSRITLLTTN